MESVAKALVNIYQGKFDVNSEIEENLYKDTLRIIRDAIDSGYADAVENGTPAPSETFRNSFYHSAEVFSAFRTHRMQNDIAATMLDGNGNLKSFRQFVKDASDYVDHKNKAWLRTEYDTAVLRAQNAAEWAQFEDEKDVYPNLEWVQSTSPNPGADHVPFWGTVLPIDSDFWDKHKPGDRWNCKCELRQTDGNVSQPPAGASRKFDPSPGLESNPFKQKEVFSDKHPYFPKNCSSCPFSSGKLMALAKDLAGGKNCMHCKACDKSISNAERKAEAKRISQNKHAVMSIIRMKSVAEKRPGKIINVKEFVTGKMLDSKKTLKNVYYHEFTAEEVKAIISLYKKPSKVKFIRISPLGEGKDMSNPKNVANISKKISRGVTHYNVYEFKAADGIFILKTEVRKKGFEIPYFIRKKK